MNIKKKNHKNYVETSEKFIDILKNRINFQQMMEEL